METKTQTSADKRFIVLVGIQLVTLLIIITYVFAPKGPGGSERAQLIRDTAAKLQAAGLSSEAINQYEEYLKDPGVDAKTRANVSYTLGQMLETEGRPEKALAWYYQVEASDPNSSQQKEAAKRIVALLETLGRHQAAKSVLSSATSLDKTKASPGKPVAQIGDKSISLEEVDAALDATPPQVKKAFEGNEGKKKFVKKYIADELLYEKAKRLGYDSDPNWLKQVEALKRESLVSRILNEDVLSKVSIDEKDLKNYFEANKTRYAQNKKAPPFDKVKQAVAQDYRMEKSQAKYQELVEQLVAGDKIKLFLENVK
jgi:tetratricopeptide (TPR) repeat protein